MIQASIDPTGGSGGEIDGSREVSGKLSLRVATLNFEPAETTFDHIVPFVGEFVETVEGQLLHFWIMGFAARPKAIAVMAFAPNDGR
ncbi:hypothetical protein [Bradyrhizobium sp. USDA 3315]